MRAHERGPAGAVLLIVLIAACGGDAEREAEPEMAMDTLTGPLSVEGFSTPESALHDPAADVYLVANINGEPTGKDDDGFISRVRPDGTVAELRWIDGAAGDFELNAPKGMAIHGDTLFVTDIDVVRAFHRVSGEALEVRPIPDAQFMNDLAVGPDGTLYATDTNANTVYRFDAGGEPVVHVAGEPLQNPNGVAALGDDILLVYWGGGAAVVDGTSREVRELPAPDGERLDGVVPLPDGSYLVSSWDRQAVLRVGMDGTVTEILGDVESPADIGYDSLRDRVLVPLFEGRLVIVSPG